MVSYILSVFWLFQEGGQHWSLLLHRDQKQRFCDRISRQGPQEKIGLGCFILIGTAFSSLLTFLVALPLLLSMKVVSKHEDSPRNYADTPGNLHLSLPEVDNQPQSPPPMGSLLWSQSCGEVPPDLRFLDTHRGIFSLRRIAPSKNLSQPLHRRESSFCEAQSLVQRAIQKNSLQKEQNKPFSGDYFPSFSCLLLFTFERDGEAEKNICQNF